MQTCEKKRRDLVLHLYRELNEVEQADLLAHLQVCPDCRAELQELSKLQNIIPEQPLLEPAESTLQVLRNAVSQKIQVRVKLPVQKETRSFSFSFLRPLPIYQIGFALLLLILGYLFGRLNAPHEQLNMQNLLTANQEIQAANSEIDPLLAGVEKIKYDPSSGSVEIFYTTINDIQLKGNLSSPAVRQMLRHAMLEENNPTVRLHAVKALRYLAEDQPSLQPELIGTLGRLLESEQNLGVRLQIMQILKNFPLNAAVKDILIKVLLYDPDPALRIEAFSGLASQKLSQLDIDSYLSTAKQDSNEYIRFHSNRLIDQYQQNSDINQEQNTPVKIMRKE